MLETKICDDLVVRTSLFLGSYVTASYTPSVGLGQQLGTRGVWYVSQSQSDAVVKHMSVVAREAARVGLGENESITGMPGLQEE